MEPEQLQPEVAVKPEAPIVTPVIPPVPDPSLDDHGISYKNRAAEYERKLQEALQINQQYQQVLGQQMQRPPVAATPDPLLAQFDEPTQRFVRQVATQVALEQAQQVKHQTMAEIEVQQQLASDPDLLPEARTQYAILKSNPVWASAPDLLTNQHAISQAKAILEKRRRDAQTAATTQQAQQLASRAQASGAGLPGTGGSPAQPATGDKETFIKNWMNDGENLRMFKLFERGKDPSSLEGQVKFREYAENAWKPTVFGGAMGQAFRALTDAQIEVVK